ncbi:MAG: hypothetical protein H6895_07050 [Defluviimonas sp.]|uniref:DUF6544 family protein n=1 Tax=Albidovulum sp. TaxID=1872424 RepID=UPI001D5FD385|nr:hypothetical protein [Paracoccaceae bacterium]MCC0063828.1 hypothetical protein [Defluviimonas sp.]
MQTVLAVLVLVALAAVAAQIVLARGFRAEILSRAAALAALPVPGPRRDLPDIVYAFARKGLADPETPPQRVILRQSALLRLKRGGKFVPLAVWQTIALGSPGFVWEAHRPGILPKIRVLDCYVEGHGRLEARVLGSIPVARDQGAEIDLAEAMRYLAELPWAPDAILGNPSIKWRTVGTARVEAALDLPGGAARVTFGFDAAGDIVEVTARDRPAGRDAEGRRAFLDWRGSFSDYREIGNRRVPMQAEVGYDYPEGYEAYYRGTVTAYSVV